MVGAHPAEINTTQLDQAVKDLRIKLASLFGHDGLWTAEEIHPAGK